MGQARKLKQEARLWIARQRLYTAKVRLLVEKLRSQRY
jgi:hypothetical protein